MSKSPRKVRDLIESLEIFRGQRGQILANNKELYEECRGLFEKLGRLDDFEPNSIEKVILVLENLPEEIKDTEIEKIEITEDKELGSKSLNEEELKELLKEYDEASEAEKVEIGEKISRLSGEKNVENLVRRQKELTQNKTEKVRERNKDKLNKFDPELREKIVEDLTKVGLLEKEEMAVIIEKAVLSEEVDKKGIEKEIKKEIKDKEEVEEIIQKIERVRAEITVETKAREIVQTTVEKLKEEEIIVSEKSQKELKKNILEAWKEGEKLVIPTEIKGSEIIIRETVKATENFGQENLETIVNYRAEELEKNIGKELRKNGIQDEALIREYSKVVNQLTNNPEKIVGEISKEEAANFVESRNEKLGAGEVDRSIDEAKFMTKNVVMAPKKFNQLIAKYNVLREKIGSEKLPKIKEIRVVDKMAVLFKNNPKALQLLNGAQKMVGFLDKVNNFPGNILTRIGAKDVGLKIITKIGGQAAGEFIKNASLVIAEQGSLQGIRSIALGIMGKGAIATGGASGALAGAVAAFQAIPVAGQIVLVAAAAIMIVKPIIDAVKNFAKEKLNINLNGVRDFISEDLGLGKIVGGVGQFAVDVGTVLVGIPALLGTIAAGAIITPVIIFFFLGFFVYSMLQQNQISSVVPPPAVGGGNCVLKSVAESEGMINCDQGAPENNYPGINRANFVGLAGRWKNEGKNYSEECYNDVVNRSLCAGVNPAYSLWVWLHESGASNYSIEDVKDFGIASSSLAPAKNFSAQINYFLKLDPASACINDPRIGGNYWLAYSANFLNGDCDPDKVSADSGITPRDYEKQIREQWSWVSSEAMPNSIKVSKGGSKCDSIGTSDGGDTPISNEYTDENGQIWICYEGGDGSSGEVPDFEAWDPNTPVPEGCPSGRPTSGYFTQGPFANNCSHQSMSVPAVDIGAGNGSEIRATHDGVVSLQHDSIYGYYIDLHGSCEGKDFYSRYAHMPEGGFRVSNGQKVSAGQIIGVVDNTGSSTGPHLHYHISGLDKNKFGQYLGLSTEEAKKLWGCCGSWNGKDCP